MHPLALVTVNALYPSRALAADLVAGHALGAAVYPVCTALAAVSHGRVTDVTEVPEDSVRAQLEHLGRTTPLHGVKVGALAGRSSVDPVCEFASAVEGPFVLDLELSGPYGETLLPQRGIAALSAHLHAPDLVIASATDAELLSGGAIESLDDAQVAAQRIVRRYRVGALLLKCGVLPSRHFSNNGTDEEPYAVDLFFDGTEFALFEAPHLSGIRTEGASSAFSLAILKSLAEGSNSLEAVQDGKRYVSDVLRATQSVGSEAPLQYFDPAVTPR